MCVHWSPLGNNMKEQGESNVLLLLWIKYHATQGTPLLVHENVKTFSSAYLKSRAETLGYRHLATIPTTGCDAALEAASRSRVCLGEKFSLDVFNMFKQDLCHFGKS